MFVTDDYKKVGTTQLNPTDWLVCLVGSEMIELDDHPGIYNVRVYSVGHIIQLAESNDLKGHPELDMGKDAWGGVDVPAEKAMRIKRWTEKSHFVGIRQYAGGRGQVGEGHQVKRFDGKRIRKLLTEKELFWLNSVLQVAELYTETVKEVEPEPKPKKPKIKTRKPKLKRKERRRMERRIRAYAYE